jgi:hypothetical protein
MLRVAGNGRLQREVGGLLVQAVEREDGVAVATRSGRAAGRDQVREREVTAGAFCRNEQTVSRWCRRFAVRPSPPLPLRCACPHR